MYLMNIANTQSTPRMKTTYPDDLKIKQKISKRLDPALGVLFSQIKADEKQSCVISGYCDEDQIMAKLI